MSGSSAVAGRRVELRARAEVRSPRGLTDSDKFRVLFFDNRIDTYNAFGNLIHSTGSTPNEFMLLASSSTPNSTSITAALATSTPFVRLHALINAPFAEVPRHALKSRSSPRRRGRQPGTSSLAERHLGLGTMKQPPEDTDSLDSRFGNLDDYGFAAGGAKLKRVLGGPDSAAFANASTNRGFKDVDVGKVSPAPRKPRARHVSGNQAARRPSQ
jgi:hypothetical protein